MGKLIDMFVEWAKKDGRWPLLALLILPGVVKFSQEYFQLSFRTALTHWSALIGCGALLVISGALYSLVSFQASRDRRILASALLLAGVAGVGAGFWQFRPAPLPSDRLVVAIARFTAVSAGAREDADNLGHSLEQMLRDRQKVGLSLDVKHLSFEIVGADERARRAAAVATATSRDGAAHVVLWGDVQRDEGQLYVEPRVTVARPLGKELPEERSLGRYTSDGPSHISFKRRLTTEVSDMIAFIYGLALYNAGRWQEAAVVFEQSSSAPNRLYHAMSLIAQYIDHFRRTFDQAGRLEYLRAAEVELGAVHQALLDVNDTNLATLSLLELGNSLRMRSQWRDAQEQYEKAEALARRTRNTALEAAARRGQARAKIGGGDVEGALKDVDHAIEIYKARNEQSRVFDALVLKAEIQEDQGNLGGAIATLDSAFSLTRSLDDRGALFYGYLDRASIQEKMAVKYAEESAFAKAYSASKLAKADYERARTIANALSWTGLARSVDGFLMGLESRRHAIEALERLVRTPSTK